MHGTTGYEFYVVTPKTLGPKPISEWLKAQGIANEIPKRVIRNISMLRRQE